MRIGKKIWIISSFVVLALLGWSMIQRTLDVAAVQECLNRDWETTFGPDTGSGLPGALPASLDSRVQNWLNHRYGGNPRGLDLGRGLQHAEYRDIVYHERFRALFRGTIREIQIMDPEGFRGDLGAALLRFPGLRSVTVHDYYDLKAPREAEWKLLFTRLRSLPNLEELNLGGRGISDAAVTPLAGHPTLRAIRVRYSELTPESAKIFRTLPRLSTLRLNTVLQLTPEEEAGWSAAIPGTLINARSNEP
jgi:hypothetical protein